VGGIIGRTIRGGYGYFLEPHNDNTKYKNNKKNNLSQFKEDHAIIGVQNMPSKVLIVTLVGPGDFRIISHNKCSCICAL